MREVPLLDQAQVAAPIQRRARARLKTTGLPPMPVHLDEFHAVRLTPIQKGVMIELHAHVWMYGGLPKTMRELADVGGVHPRTFAKMEAVIAPHFDIDEAGCWHHYDLQEARERAFAALDRRPVLRSVSDGEPVKQVSPELSKTRSKAARKRWNKGEDVFASSDANTEARFCIGPMQNDASAASGDAKSRLDHANFASDLHDPCSRAASLLVLDSLDESKDFTSKPASLPRADDASGSCKTDANSACKPDGDKADGSPASGSSPDASPPDAVIVDAVLRICGDKVGKGDAYRAVRTYREAIAEGVDFSRDILPKIASFARNKPRVDNPANHHIMAEARAHCADRLAAEALARPSAVRAPPVFADPAITRFARALQTSLGADVFMSWFATMVPVPSEPGTLSLAFPTRFVRNHVAQYFEGAARAALKASGAPYATIAFVVRDTS